jgi:hypothetical protein
MPNKEADMTLKNRLFIMFFIFCNTILLVFLCNMGLTLRSDIAGLRGDLATKQDLAVLKAGQAQSDLEDRCTRCHSEVKFAGLHGTEMESALARMQALPDAHLSAGEVEALHASLVLDKCLACHGKGVLQTLTLKSGRERGEIIARMRQKEGSGLQDVEVTAIERSVQQIYGF